MKHPSVGLSWGAILYRAIPGPCAEASETHDAFSLLLLPSIYNDNWSNVAIAQFCGQEVTEELHEFKKRQSTAAKKQAHVTSNLAYYRTRKKCWNSAFTVVLLLHFSLFQRIKHPLNPTKNSEIGHNRLWLLQFSTKNTTNFCWLLSRVETL